MFTAGALDSLSRRLSGNKVSRRRPWNRAVASSKAFTPLPCDRQSSENERNGLLIKPTTLSGGITVLLSVDPPDGTTRFVDQVTRYAPEDIDFVFFSWRRALLGRWDVFHVHWPEFLVRGRRPVIAAARTALFLLLLLRLRMSKRKKVVRTLHNVAPHDPGSRTESRLLAALDRRTDLFVRLNDVTPVPSDGASVRILHGHYRDVLPRRRTGTPVPGRLLFFGRIEPYKNVVHLVETFARTERPDLSLRIVGRASQTLQAAIMVAAERDPRASTRFGFVPDEEMVDEMVDAQLLVLPYTEMHNSGIVLVALSLNRPVLVPRTPANALLAEEVGSEWVRMFDGDLDDVELIDAVNATSGLPPEGPTLAGRDWRTVGESYADAYHRAVGAPGCAPE